MNKLQKVLVGCAVCTCSMAGFASPAFAGEITGGPTPKATPVQDRVAASICSFSGQDAVDGSPIDSDDKDDVLFGRTQSLGQIVKAFGSGVAQGGGAGAACKPGGEG